MERDVETGALECLQRLGYALHYGPHLGPDAPAAERTAHAQVILRSRLEKSIQTLNPRLNATSREQACRAVLAPPTHPTLVDANRWFYGLLADGVEVEHRHGETGEVRMLRAKVIDLENAAANDFVAVQQLTVEGPSGKAIRADLVLYVNGLPLVVIELKDPTDPNATIGTAIDQLRGYTRAVPDLFVPNLLMVASDGLLTRVGSITSGPQRFMPWRPASGGGGGKPSLEALIKELLEPKALLDYLRTCVVFEEDGRGNIEKKIAGYHQFRAVRKARQAVLAALKPPVGVNTGPDAGKGGVVWHTQGSGKSLTMLMLAGALVREPAMQNPTIVVVTDRNDLDGQLFDTFARGRSLLRQEPVQAKDRKDLKALLDRASGGVVFTTIQKFTEEHGEISERANVVVMADEAHRSQYGFVDGGAKWMREALPNATFLGFTGTPIDRDDKSTPRVFGDYADTYDVRQAVADGATVPIYYEPRIVKLTIDENAAAEAEAAIEKAAEADELGEVDAADNVRVPLEALVGADERLKRVAAFIVGHWEGRRSAMEGKAMVVTMSRDIAARLYDEIKALRPDWHDADDGRGAMKVVMNDALPPRIQGESEDDYNKRIDILKPHLYSKGRRERLAARFKDPRDGFRVAIVVDMWLTGFDVPCAHTMYLDKPLKGHNLMQAIARVNRVYGDKPGGLVVDLLGLADQLADALATYAKASGTDEKPIQEVQNEAVPAMEAALEKLGRKGFFDGFDYTPALTVGPRDVLSVYVNAIDYVLGKDEGWKRFRGLVKELSTAFALAVPRPESEPVAPHLAFFQRVVAMVRKRLADEREGSTGPSRGGSDIDLAVRQVIGSTVDAGEVIDLFAAAGLGAEGGRLDILSDDFLHRVSALEQKNLALETLRKLLNDQIKITERKNLIQSQRFREALAKAMLRYTNKQITTAEMIAQLLELAKWVREAQKHGSALGLNDDEVAFYDALAENGSAKKVMKSDQLRLMARELAEMVRKMPKLDWTQRESVRADLRRKVRRLLAMYGYPPDLSEDATQLVLRQAELSTELGSH